MTNKTSCIPIPPYYLTENAKREGNKLEFLEQFIQRKHNVKSSLMIVNEKNSLIDRFNDVWMDYYPRYQMVTQRLSYLLRYKGLIRLFLDSNWYLETTI